MRRPCLCIEKPQSYIAERPGFTVTTVTPRRSSFIDKRRTKNGGGGIRTPVPGCFEPGIYMFSRFIFDSPCQVQTTGRWFGYFGVSFPGGPEQTVGSSPLSGALTEPVSVVRQDEPPY